MIRNKKRIIVCDYDNPKGYTFPSFGFGSSEKRIWHFAKTLSEIDDFEVIVTGPLWLQEYIPRATHFKKRLESHSRDEFLEIYGKCDYLFAGHEYFDKDEWVTPFKKCANILISYQLHPYEYTKISFNQKDKFLFCYSSEMLERYKDQKPIKQLLFHSGVNEDPFFTKNPEDYLLWIGRLDRDKAPHIAIKVAKKLNKRLKILGKTVYQEDYFNSIKDQFESDDIDYCGVRFGKEKMELISKAKCAIYTLDRNYSEAGAGVLGEILSCGVPIAGMSYKGNDSIYEAISSDKLGNIVDCSGKTEDEIILDLCKAVDYCVRLDRSDVHRIGSQKYNPKKLVLEVFEKIEAIVG